MAMTIGRIQRLARALSLSSFCKQRRHLQ